MGLVEVLSVKDATIFVIAGAGWQSDLTRYLGYRPSLLPSHVDTELVYEAAVGIIAPDKYDAVIALQGFNVLDHSFIEMPWPDGYNAFYMPWSMMALISGKP